MRSLSVLAVMGRLRIRTSERMGGEQMKVIASFVGRNKDFKAWLAAGMPQNVICLAEYWEKRKTALRRTKEKLSTQV